MAVALCEAGADVYVVDLPAEPSSLFNASQKYVEKLGQKLHYFQGDVVNQQQMWDIGEHIGDIEGRLDFCVAAAGVFDMQSVRDLCPTRSVQVGAEACPEPRLSSQRL